MILSDREIRILIERGRIGISPLPLDRAWSSTSVDLTLAAKYRIWNRLPGTDSMVYDAGPRFRPGTPLYSVNKLIEQYTTELVATPITPMVLEKGGFILAWTAERVRLPNDSRVAARVEGKSSLARIGLGVHVTAPTIHAGFGGEGNGQPIQLEIWNTGPLSIELPTGIPICQLIFEEVHGTPEQGYAGQFANQGPGKA